MAYEIKTQRQYVLRCVEYQQQNDDFIMAGSRTPCRSNPESPGTTKHISIASKAILPERLEFLSINRTLVALAN